MTAPLSQAAPPTRPLRPLDARLAEVAAQPDRTWGVLDALLGVLVVPLSVLVAVLVLMPFDAPGIVFLTVGTLALGAGALLAARRPARQSGGLRGALGLDAPRAGDVWLVVLFTVVATAVVALAVGLLGLLVPALAGVAPDNTSGLRDEPLPVLLVVAAAAVLVAPVVEELLFRGLVLRGLMLRLGFWPAAVVSSTLFGLLHATGTGLQALPVVVATGVFGLALCVLVRRTGRLGPAILAHALRNALAMGALVAAAL
ncbi:MAG: CPBP family intramembrane metalloprotease [Actinomycetota bacterium]|jgi:membrane protease YdiL (CAAX protease family)|nr:CPBP family intramembrane metalloprotease [Actinomycetota bacterium]